MLTAYLSATSRLLQNPVPDTDPLFSDEDLTAYINQARQQVAGAAECVVGASSLTLTNAVSSYRFTAFTSWSTGGVVLTGIQGALAISQMAVSVGGGPSSLLEGRPWWYLQRYRINTGAAVATGTPNMWAQRGRGLSGTFVVNPTPNASNIAVVADSALLPVDLVDDTTAEAIPVPWQTAIPYYAAAIAYMSAQRGPDSQRMFNEFMKFAEIATQMSTPSRFPDNFPGGVGARLAAMRQLLTIQPQQQGAR